MSIATGYPWDGPIFRPGAQGESLEMLGGPAIFLSVQALDAEPLSQPETQEHAWDKLRPLVLLLGLSMSANGCSNGRNRSGGIVFRSSDDSPAKAISASMVTRARSLHAIDFAILQSGQDQPSVRAETVEGVLTKGLGHFLDMAKGRLDLDPPLQVHVGLDGVENFTLRARYQGQASSWEDKGQILVNRVEHKFDIKSYTNSADDDPAIVLLPFFRKVYEEAGCARP